MSAVDLDDFGALWREEAPEQAATEFEPIVRATVRKAKLVQYAELGLSGLLLAAIAVSLSLDATPATIAIVAMLALGTLWSSWKRHLLRDVALLVDGSSREAYLASALRAAEAQLKRSTIGLWLLFPGFALGLLLKHSMLSGGRLDTFVPTFLASLVESRWAVGTVVALLLLFAWLIRGNLRLRGEVSRLQAVAEDYAREARIDRLGETSQIFS